MSNHLLHIDTSLRTSGSRSRLLSARFADAWRHAHPDGTVTYRDLAANGKGEERLKAAQALENHASRR